MEIKNRPNRNEASHTGKTLLAQLLLEKYNNVAFAAILLFGACVFSAYSKNDDEKALGVDTTNRVDKYKDMESLVESQPFSKLQGVSVGNAQDNDAKTGVTVFFFPKASMASAVVLGGGPASREVPLLDPQRNTQPLNALVFSGGSAYGLAASDGVANCLEEHGHGYDTGFGLVPIVCQSCIFDLSYGKGNVRPDREMGYKACQSAIAGNTPLSGNVGAGTGATVGKPGGMAYAQKSGIGYAAARLGKLEVGVAVVVNALGDIFQDGVKIAGMTTADRKGFVSAEHALLKNQYSDLIAGNTTIAAVFTNARLSVADLQKVANIASTGMARCIRSANHGDGSEGTFNLFIIS
jgi:L-aminopeptidase/D-esterase-like protein